MQTFLQDLRYAARMLWKAPGFTAVAMLALGLGIGANSAIFSAVDVFLLRPLPVKNPGQIVALFETDRERRSTSDKFSYPDYLAYRDGATVFSGMLARRMINAALGGATHGGEAGELIWGEMVSGNYFEVLGVRAQRGRTFHPEEDRTPGTHPVTVISHSLWQRRYNSDPSIVGKIIDLNGQPFTVIGVAPEQFAGTEFAMAADFWAPMMAQPQLIRDADADVLTAREDHWLEVLGRLNPGATLAQAEANLDAVARRLAETYPGERSAETRVAVLPETGGRFGDASRVISLGAAVAMAAVGLVLLIACANIANLLLARAAYRRKEIGVRLALGASRARILRQLMTESLLLALGGGALGLLIASWTANLLLTFMPALPFRVALDFSPDARSLAWTFFVACAAGLIFGLAPALQASAPDVIGVLKTEASGVIGGPGRKGRRWPELRDLLVVGQVALSLVVLVCGALFVGSLVRAQNIDPGFRAGNAAALSLNPGLLGYGDEQGLRLYSDLLRRARELPGVASASITSVLPLAISHSYVGPVVLEGQAPPPPGEGTSVMYAVVGTGYFETLGIKLTAGRDFTERDDASAPGVAIISEAMARHFYPGESPLGKRFRLSVSDEEEDDSPYREIVGVVSDAKYKSLGEVPQNYLYVPQLQNYTSGMTLVARGNGDAGDLARRLAAEVRGLDPKLAVFDVKTLESHLDFALWGPRTAATVSAAFGLLALGLAALGLFGVMSYTVAQRTREIGVRLALGAQHTHVLRLILTHGMRLTALGIVLGLAAALALTRVMTSLLYGISATDPLLFAGAVLLLTLVAFLAAYVPARRATRVDPMETLREV